MSLSQIIRPLLLAPIGAIVVTTVVTLPKALSLSTGHAGGLGPQNLMQLLLVYWFSTALVCYAAELLFVVPVLMLWPAARQPSVLFGAVWGVLVSCCTVATVTLALPGAGPSGDSFWLFRNGSGAVLWLGACGLASGVAYSVISRAHNPQ